jgi:putative PIN family toxin of toxin-antitoxin system
VIVVLDTNVLVSGLLRAYGDAGAIVRMVAEGTLQAAYDVRILSEYREVLARPKFGFDQRQVEYLLEAIRTGGRLISSRPLALRLPDAEDEPFLEIAQAAEAILITGDLKHFPRRCWGHAEALNPKQFVERFYRG